MTPECGDVKIVKLSNLQFEVETGLGRIRLDDFLFSRLNDLSRMYLRELVKTNRVLVNGEFANTGVRLRSSDFIEVEADLSCGTSMRPEAIPLDIVYEDDAILVVNKSAGMLVHPTHRDKNGTLLNALVYHLNCSDGISPTVAFPSVRPSAARIRPGLVHRLDRETSGLIVVAKTVKVHRRLAMDFMRRRVEKRYLALVEGIVRDDEGMISAPIGRFAEQKHWGIKPDGKISETRFVVKRRDANSTLLELEPVTGRTNQLRIHCAHIGHPIVGDIRRGGREFVRLCLHANRIAFRHPLLKEQMEFSSEIPECFQT